MCPPVVAPRSSFAALLLGVRLSPIGAALAGLTGIFVSTPHSSLTRVCACVLFPDVMIITSAALLSRLDRIRASSLMAAPVLMYTRDRRSMVCGGGSWEELGTASIPIYVRMLWLTLAGHQAHSVSLLTKGYQGAKQTVG